MTSTINGDMEFGSDGFPTDEEYDRREIKLGGPVIYCGGGRWMLAEEVANCNDCETPLDHLRDGTTEEGQRCNNCYWEGQGGRDAADAIITPDYRVIRVEFGEIDNTDQEEKKPKNKKKRKKLVIIDAPPPKCDTKNCECFAAKNKYYPNSEGGEFWTLCEKCYKEDQEDEEEDMDMTTCYACDELFDNDDLSAMCQREDCKIHGQRDDGSFDPRSLCKDCFVNNNPATDEHLEAKEKKHKKLVIIDAPPPKWHEKCSKCQNTKHDRDWIYCLQNRAYCGACSPSWGCDFDYCQACNC